MSEPTVESIFLQIIQLSPFERARLRRVLDQWEQAVQWVTDYRREYFGQWVALDGDRLIAHSPNYNEVLATAQADSAHSPMVTFIEDRDNELQIIWK